MYKGVPKLGPRKGTLIVPDSRVSPVPPELKQKMCVRANTWTPLMQTIMQPRVQLRLAIIIFEYVQEV